MQDLTPFVVNVSMQDLTPFVVTPFVLIEMRGLPDPPARYITGKALCVKPLAEPVHQWAEWWQAISSNRTRATKQIL